MNRYKDYNVNEIINYETLYESLELCKLGKMWKDSVIEFNAYSDFYIVDILDSFNGKQPLYLNPFFHTIISERGKQRLLCSLHIRDRVIQKTINRNFILPAFRPTLIYDNAASLEDRGMDFAINRLRAHLEKAYRQYGKNFYVLKCDIKSYFDSISHEYCLDLIKRHTTDPMIIKFFNILFRMYKYDSMIHNGEYVDFGIGLGGEIPQSFGIIVLNEIDHKCKELYRIPYMERYMDDIILIHPNQQYLVNVRDNLQLELSKIGLTLHPNKTVITHIDRGIKFLKFHYYLSDTGSVYLKPDKSGIKREKRKLRSMADLLEDERIIFTDILQSYQAWKGHIKRADCFELVNHMDMLFDELFINSWYNEYIPEIEIII